MPQLSSCSNWCSSTLRMKIPHSFVQAVRLCNSSLEGKSGSRRKLFHAGHFQKQCSSVSCSWPQNIHSGELQMPALYKRSPSRRLPLMMLRKRPFSRGGVLELWSFWVVESSLAPIWRSQSGSLARNAIGHQSGEAQSGRLAGNPVWQSGEKPNLAKRQIWQF